MSLPGIFDHLYAAVVFVAFPLYARYTFPALVDDIRRRGEPARINGYRHTVLTWIVFACVLLSGWHLFDRSWIELGFRWPPPLALACGLFVAAAGVAIFAQPLRRLAADPDNARQLHADLGDLIEFLPVSNRDQRWFRLVAVNAGLTEELVFRGYLLWYLGNYLDTWTAAVIAVLMFALAHLYQGIRQLPGLVIISSIAVALYLWTDSLLVPVLFHIAHDLVQGHYIAEIRRNIAATD